MKVGVLGRVAVWDDDGREVSLRPQLRRLLGLLVADGSTVTLDQIAEHVADGRITGSAARTAVGRLRTVIGHRLVTVGSGYELVLAADELDASVFERLTERAVGARPKERVDLLSAALREWRGPALGDLADDGWAAPFAAHFDRRRLDTIEDLAEALIDCGRWTDAVAVLEPHLVDVPYQERPIALLMRALAGAGRVTDALRSFHRFRSTLRHDVGLEPSRELAALELDLLREAEPGAVDEPRSTPSHEAMGNLPDPLSSFVGRVDEVKELVEDLDTKRLITLTGVGGAGKTRLSVRVARKAADRFPDGSWFIDLAAISASDDVAGLAATTLGVHLLDGSSATTAIVDHLRGRSALLVVDNCEHVLARAASLVDEITRWCPSIHVIATSRERLGLDGEQVHVVPRLDDLEAHALFCERANGIDDRFVPDGDRTVIEAICRRLDGIPLAIELAAARTSSLTPADVLARLDDQFRLLRGGRGPAQRHDTLAAAIAWSYQLLDDDEREVFRRLSVFPGDFDAEAAIAVGTGGVGSDLDGRRVDDALDSLVAKSLVVSDRSGRHARYRLLETVRAFARARLEERRDDAAVRRRHQLHFLSVAQRIRELNEPSAFADMSVFEMVRCDWHNFRSAVSTALDDGAPELAAGVAVLPPVFYLFLEEHAEWIDSILEQLPDDSRMTCMCHAFSALWSTLRGQNAAAFRKARRGLELDDGMGGISHRILWWALGETFLNTGDPVEGLEAARRSLAAGAVGRDQPDTEVVMPLELSCMCGVAADPRSVQQYADRLAAVAAVAPSQVNVAAASNGAGFAALARGDIEGALECFRATCEVTRDVPHMYAEGLKNLAVAASWSDSPGASGLLFDALDHGARNRMWSFVWVVVEATAIQWSRRRRLLDAAVLVGHLDRHGLAYGALIEGRRAIVDALGAESDGGASLERGAAMSRDDLVAFALTGLRTADRDDRAIDEQ